MKYTLYALMLIGLLGGAPVCYAQTTNNDTSIEDVKKETQDMLQALGAYSADKRDEAVQKAKDGMNNLDKRIDALEARIDENWGKMSDAARKEARENLQALRKQRNKVAEWYGSMRTSSAAAWDQMKEGFSAAYKDLTDAWEKSKKEFNTSK
jgi:hypothetical protein